MLNESVMLGTFFDRSKTMRQFNINASYDIKINGVSIASEINQVIQGPSLYSRVNHLVKFINDVIGNDDIVFIDNGNDNFAVVYENGEDLGKATVMVKVCRTVCFPEIETVDGLRAKQRDVELDKEFSRKRFEQLQECIAELAFRTCPEIYGLVNVADYATNRFSISHFEIVPAVNKSEAVTVESGTNPMWRIQGGKSYANESAVQEQSVEVATVKADEKGVAFDLDGFIESTSFFHPRNLEEEISFDLDGFMECLPICHPRNFYSLVADFVRPVELFRKKFKRTDNGVSHEQLGEMVAVSKGDMVVQIFNKSANKLACPSEFKDWIIDGMNT